MRRTDYILLSALITGVLMIGTSAALEAWSSLENFKNGCYSVHQGNRKIQARLFDELPPTVPIVAKQVEVVKVYYNEREMLPLLPNQRPSDALEPTP